MRTPGMVRKMDSLGRIVIPWELRKAMDMQSGDELELRCEGNCLTIRKFAPHCIFCCSSECLVTYEEKYICSVCLRKLRKV